ncbi:MAG: putative bicarbonate transporter, IctB family, partial [Leptolyngbyaceae bacterium]|nr:putative bicarbonate transporter, IctB family [Leptolyngbyaceae bacterium]
MHSAWQQLTLSYLPLHQWVRASYVHHFLVGSLQKWRQSSWFMQWADPIGVLLLSLVFALAPFVSNTLIGFLIAVCIGFWVLLTLADEARPGLTPIHVLVLLYWGIATAATALSPVKKAAFLGWGKLSLYLLLFVLMARVLRSPRLRSWLVT